jgi:hypothetical protein
MEKQMIPLCIAVFIGGITTSGTKESISVPTEKGEPMYNSPIMILESTIDSFANAIIKQKDDAIFAEIQHSFGVDMDKEELIRALQYDRNQYEKGYADGKEDAVPKWIPVTEMFPEFGEVVMVFDTRDDYMGLCEFRGFAWDDNDNQNRWDLYEITHRMPLPEPPKEG